MTLDPEERARRAAERSKTTSAEYLRRRKDLGLVRCCIWIPDTDVARAMIRQHAALIRKTAGVDEI